MSTELLNAIANRVLAPHEGVDPLRVVRMVGGDDARDILQAHAIDAVLARVVNLAVGATNLSEDPRRATLAAWQQTKAYFLDQLQDHKVEPKRLVCVLHPTVMISLRADIRAISGGDIEIERGHTQVPEFAGVLDGVEIYESSHVTPIHARMHANLWLAIDERGSPIEYHLPEPQLGKFGDEACWSIGPATVSVRAEPFEAWSRIRGWNIRGWVWG